MDINLRIAILEMSKRNDLEIEDDRSECWEPSDFPSAENKLGMKIPSEYKEFCLKYGAVGAEHYNCFLVKSEDFGSRISEMQAFGRHPNAMVQSNIIYRNAQHPILKNEMIFVGSANAGREFILLDCSHELTSKVFVWGGKKDANSDDELYSPILVADTIADFLYNLQPLDTLDTKNQVG